MKYKAKFSYSFSDVVNPKRFKRAVKVEVDLEFPFEKYTDAVIIQLKKDDPERYKAMKLEDFATQTGQKAEDFQKDFDAAIRKNIDINFKDYVKNNAKPMFTEEQWGKLLTSFEQKQALFVKAEFTKSLSAIVKTNYEKLEKLRKATPRPDEHRMLDVDEAFLLWIGRAPIKFGGIEDKFYDDHIVKDVSEADAFAKAVARYRKNKVKVSTVVKLNPATILSKANSGSAYPSIYRGEQQIAVMVTGEAITTKLTFEKVVGQKSEREFSKNHKHSEKIEDGNWASAEFVKGSQIFYVMGHWDPESGKASLYHYQEDSSKPQPGMLKQYLRWQYSHEKGKFVGPSPR